jgi:hypothetical protein
MATLILAAAGKFAGAALFGGAGAILGQAAGAIAGSLIDQRLFSTSRTVEGNRLGDLSVQSSTEGAALPKVYGRVRLAGQIIWATRFEEVVREESAGGKGGGGGGTTTVRSYDYYASFAVALCEGPVSRVGAVWADGKPMDLDGVTWRVHEGAADQLPDPLIAALQGEAPAYRNTAYVVFERLPLAIYGDRLPQLSFEVIRAVEPLEEMVRAVTVIPGAGEFVYQTTPVTWTVRPGVSETANRNVTHAPSNWAASMDELQALCPNLERVALVVSWFGESLACPDCTIRPKVETHGRVTSGATWSVSGLSGETAQEVSRHDGRPAYGGTPSDASVIAAISDLRARGLQVALYPFLMMDVPAENGLVDPYGDGNGQQPYPWRGRITASKAPGQPGSPEATAAMGAEIAGFAGSAAPAHFSSSGGGVTYAGPAEWSYRRFILHHAALARAAGGVDAFLIGSEMRGLTRLRDDTGGAPFVGALKQLAGDVRAMLPETALTYAADWSEYGAHQPEEGELRFPLDPLWADPAIDAVGIDAYFPLADQREGGDPEGNRNPYDLACLAAHVAGGEDFDWYYLNEADRRAGMRTPISDGAYGKPWVYRAKDLAGWWGNPHHERIGGVERVEPTSWVPGSKPVWLTELGVPAISRGANEPNVFFDAKSSEAAWPRFSDGGRDDLIQRRALEAVIGRWSGWHPQVQAGDNPVSPVYGGPMVDPAHIFLWSWDARPYPVFPGQTDLWADGDNWRAGHWLNGRFGGVSLKGLVRALADDFAIPQEALAVGDIAGTLDGLAVAGPVAARSVLAPLLQAHGLVAVDLGTAIGLRPAWSEPVDSLDAETVVAGSRETPAISTVRAQDADLPAEIRLAARDPARDHRRYVVASRRREGLASRVEELDLGASLDPALAATLADRMLIRQWSEREEVSLALPPGRLDLEPGDVLTLAADPRLDGAATRQIRIVSLEDGESRRVNGRSVREPVPVRARILGGEARPRTVTATTGAPQVLALDLPPLPGDSQPEAPRVAAFASPWPGAFQIYRARAGVPLAPHVLVETPALLGTLATPLAVGPLARWDRGGTVEVEISGGLLSSVSPAEVLAGANALAVISPDGGLEVLQFAVAELVAPRRYRLSMLLRGLLGTETAAVRETPAGARMVLLDQSLAPLSLRPDEIGVPFELALVPAGRPLDAPARVDLQITAGARGLMPFAPVHLSARREAGGTVRFAWIRRTRIGGDSWREGEVPLGEDREAYVAELLAPGGEALVSRTVETAELALLPEEEISLFGTPQGAFELRVRQVSALVGPGVAARATLSV